MVDSTRGAVNYGATDNKGVSRFQVVGDTRRMFPVFAAGGLFSPEQLGQDIQSGSAYSYFTGANNTGTGNTPALAKTDVLGSQNMISNGKALYAFGAPEPFGSVIALRLGVTGTSGGNAVSLSNTNYYATLFKTSSAYPGSNISARGLLWGGDIIYQNTNATTSTIGAAVEAFTVNVGGTVTVAGASTSVTGNATTFTTASLTAAPYAAYHGSKPTKTLLMAGDLILITLDSGSKSLHRITAVSAANGAGAIGIAPAAPSAATAKAYTLYRSGGGGGVNSKIITIFDGTDWYNYYVGNGGALNPTIECFKVPGAGGTWSHFMCPQTTSSGANVADVQATDIAYYKGFLLYGYGSAISWSVAGFPTSFTTGFGPDDFPSTNITVVDNTDMFLGFEYLGEQLVAIFENGIWEIQATGNVPEFQFFKLPEPVGAYHKSVAGGIPPRRRPHCSARNAVFYWSHQGVMMLTGGTAKLISSDIFTTIMNKFNTEECPNLEWEPHSDSVFVTAGDASGFVYNIPTGTWSYVSPTTISGNTYIGLTGDLEPFLSTVSAAMYDVTNEEMAWFDKTIGGPWNPIAARFIGLNCIWASPIINLGDSYGTLGTVGIQFDGIIGTNTCSFRLYTGKTPYSMQLVQTGSVTTIDNRVLLARRVDAQYMAVQFSFSAVSSTTGIVCKGMNVYFEPGGF